MNQKVLLWVILSFACLGNVLSVSSQQIKEDNVKADQIVNFPDGNLEKAIRDAIGKQSGDIYESDLKGLTSLDASCMSIKDLGGLEYCTNLAVLDLSVNQITDITPLANLTQLKELYLEWNNINDISPLANLTQLTLLIVADNKITDIKPINNMTNLTFLNLRINWIMDITPLSNLTQLTDLDLGCNQIMDITPIANLTKVSDLDLELNQITDITPIANFTLLTYLALNGNQITDITPLANFTLLRTIYLGGNQILDIEPLVKNNGIKSGDYLDISTNPLNYISINQYIPILENRGVDVYHMSYTPELYLSLLTQYGDVWAAKTKGFPPCWSPARWGWLGFKYDPAGDYNPWPGTFYPIHGDLDGNGIQDLVQFTPYSDVWVALNTGQKFMPPSRWGWPGFYYRELNGNGYFTGCGDFNGDGLDDLVQITEHGEAWVAVSSGLSLENPTNWGALGFYYNRDTGKLPIIADFNGDSKDDIAQVTGFGDVWVSLSEGGFFGLPQRWGWLGFQYSPQQGYIPLSGDVNSDGKADLIQITPYSDVWVSLSSGNTFGNPKNWGTICFYYNELNGWYPLTGDLNADGKTDLIQITPTGDPWMSLSNGSTFDPPERLCWIGFTWSRQKGSLPFFLGYEP